MIAALRCRRVYVVTVNRSPFCNRSTLCPLSKLYSFSSFDTDSGGGAQGASSAQNDFTTEIGRQNPPEPIPNRPLRGEKRSEHLSRGTEGFRSGGRGYDKSTASIDTAIQRSRLAGPPRGNRTGQQSPSTNSGLFQFDKFGDDKEEEITKKQHPPHSQSLVNERKHSPSQRDKLGHDFLEKFKLGFDKGDRDIPQAANAIQEGDTKAADEKPPPPQDADEIFRKMKETGLIPNAVAMLDGLCKDGLVEEAMKLFGRMREKGTIPEVVIYTAVVDGFCKAQKLDDAIRIFRKMQNKLVEPNAFTYSVLINGLCKDKRLEDALDLCVEMLETGHSPNLATFTSLVDGFCRERGVEEAQNIIGALRQKGFSYDEKAVRGYLDKKGPSSPLVWEAILGRKAHKGPSESSPV